jgi:hypothetical protein
MSKRDFCHLDILLIARMCMRACAVNGQFDDLKLLSEAMMILDTDLIDEEAKQFDPTTKITRLEWLNLMRERETAA